ncbi:hypothetical protein H5410_064269 [Solanum commersonii]|uniref:HVA22-like protein n=1 Tax=Solanum commersonii TaxID=4109 RepID=A0A9J5VZS2_SOLCO|nr:hypothetical protein H5410_064269 [Solanum commersonii]
MGGKLILPLTLLKMVKLRHLQIYSKAHFSTLNAAEELLENSKFNNLITLSSPTFCCVRDAELMLRTPNLRKLRCSFVGWGYPSHVMSSLTRLETLSIKMDSCGSSPSNFPLNLKKLTLSNFTMYWLQSSIAMLPNLQVLKLVTVFFSKAEWEVRSDKFHQLKVLKVVDCPCFKKWNVSDDAFPRLEHLVLRRCRYLEAIPSRFGDITSLISIEVKSCKESLVESAMVIRESQVEEMQNYDFKVFINKYASIKAIETKSRADDRQWLTYWVLYSLITLFELSFSKLIEWFPIWSYAKLGAICWLVLPYFNGASNVYENFIRPFYRNPQVKIWYVPLKKDIFSKPDDVLTAAEKYIEEHGPQAFERLLAKADRDARTRRNNYMTFDDDYRY